MFGKDFTLEHLLRAFKEAKPKQATIGTHHYVQLAESKILADADPEDLKALELIAPAGAAVPSSCEKKWMEKFTSLKVCTIDESRN